MSSAPFSPHPRVHERHSADGRIRFGLVRASRRRTNHCFFFVYFPPFATAGNWRGVHRIQPLPPSFASLIIAGVIEIRIKRVGVEVEVRGSGGEVWGNA